MTLAVCLHHCSSEAGVKGHISFFIRSLFHVLGRGKGRDLTQSYDNYTTISDRLRTVSWGNYSHPTGVIKPINEIPTLQLTTTVV